MVADEGLQTSRTKSAKRQKSCWELRAGHFLRGVNQKSTLLPIAEDVATYGQ